MIGTVMIDQMVRRERLMDDLRAVRGNTSTVMDLGRPRQGHRTGKSTMAILTLLVATMRGLIG